jgi:hypothetical protein
VLVLEGNSGSNGLWRHISPYRRIAPRRFLVLSP